MTAGQKMSGFQSFVALLFLAIFCLFQIFFLQKEKRIKQKRAGLTFDDFWQSLRSEKIPEPVAEVVHRVLVKELDFCPLPNDRLYEDHGIVDGDFEDLIIEISKELGISWQEDRVVEVPAETVGDLVWFFTEKRRSVASPRSSVTGTPSTTVTIDSDA